VWDLLPAALAPDPKFRTTTFPSLDSRDGASREVSGLEVFRVEVRLYGEKQKEKRSH
jgi:hypothetical protein